MKTLPRVRAINTSFRNPDYDRNDDSSKYIAKEMLAEVFTWNINSGTMRVRWLNDDGSKFGGEPSNISDEVLRETFSLVRVEV